MEKIRAEYLDFVIDHCGRLEPRGIPQTVRSVTLPLDKVYVSLTAEREQESDRELLLPDPFDATLDGNPQARLRMADRRGRREIVKQNVTLPQAVATSHRIILLGKPGAGKTTLTRFLAARFATACRDNTERVTDGDGNDYGEARLPIRIRISEYADAFRKDHNLPLRTYLARACNHAGTLHEQITSLFEDALQNGRALILLDGLDEVADAPTRAEIARRIEAFMSGLEAGCRVLVTSRVAGYAEARLDDRFTLFELQDMSRPNIEQFVRRWCAAVERFHAPDAPDAADRGKQESDALLRAIDASEGVRRLAVNPLLLTILALIHRTNTRLPEHRIELYKLATQTLLRDWREANAGPEGRVVTRDEEETLLWPLALWMHTEVETGRVPADDVQRKLRLLYSEPRGLSPKHPDVIRQVEDFLKRVTEHSGLFVLYPPDEYGFLHLTFEEYMAGCALVSNSETAAENLRNVRHLARWEEPLRLAISAQTGSTAANLIRKAIWDKDTTPTPQRKTLGSRIRNYFQQSEVSVTTAKYTPSKYEDILRRDLRLAARCLSDCASMDVSLSRQIVEELIAIRLDKDEKGKYWPLREYAENILGTLSDSEAGEQARRLLLTALKDHDSGIRKRASFALGTIGQGSEEALEKLIAALNDEDKEVRWAVVDSLGKVGQGSEEVLEKLIAALNDEDKEVRKAAAEALGRVGQGSEKVVQKLVAALDDGDGDVKYMAVLALGAVGQGSEEALEKLIAALNDEDKEVRKAAAEALGRVGQGSEEVVQKLIAAFKDADHDVKYQAACAFKTINHISAEAMDLLYAALKNSEKDMRCGAAVALKYVGQVSEEVIQILLATISDEDSDVRAMALYALATVGLRSTKVLQTLLTALNDATNVFRWVAAEGLGRIGQGSVEVLQALLAALNDNDSGIRSAAAEALGKVGQGSGEVIQKLVAALNDKDREVRKAAAEALGKVGQGSEEVIQKLVATLDDEFVNVRDVAWTALDSLI